MKYATLLLDANTRLKQLQSGVGSYRGTSLIRNRHPPRTPLGP
jgi:hypothetical protein